MKNTKSITPTPKQQQLLNKAIELHQSGQLDEAERAYKKLSSVIPTHSVLLLNLSNIALQKGRFEEALQLTNYSLSVAFNQADVHYNRGIALDKLERLEEAIESYNQVLALNPLYIDAYYNRGNTFIKLKHLEEAVESFNQMLVLNPHHVDAYYNRAIALDDLNRQKEAIESYNQALVLNPQHVAAYYNRGNDFLFFKRFDEAVENYTQVLALNPYHVDAYYNLGIALGNLERNVEAVENYNQVIALSPDYVEAYYNRAIAFDNLQLLEEAVESYNQVLILNPDYVNAYYNRGVTLNCLGRLDEALASINKALIMNPDYVGAYYIQGVIFKDLRRFDEALVSINQAILLNPDFVEAYYVRAGVLKDLKCLNEALSSYNEALRLNANYVVAYYNRAIVLYELNRPHEAIASYNHALALNPDYADAYCNRGLILSELKQLDAAIDSYNQALMINPKYDRVYFNRGTVFYSLKRLDDAINDYDRTIAINPTNTKAYWNKALAKIVSGEFLEAWPLYEWRWQDNIIDSVQLQTTRPLFKAEEKVERLFIWAEQGVGDELFFGTMLHDAQQLADQIIVSVDKRLMALFQRSLPDIRFVDRHQSLHETDYDAHVPMGSLGQYFRNSLENFNQQSVGYIQADRGRRDQLRKSLGGDQTFICGISWNSKAKHDGLLRSLTLEQLACAIAGPSIKLVSLQYSDVNVEIAQLYEQHGIKVEQIKSIDNFNDLDGLAALIDACDLVISVDNSTVHFAGALGKEVWVLLPYQANYRWMFDREDSPWYPSAKLFRQPTWGDWGSVITNIRNDLMVKTDLLPSHEFSVPASVPTPLSKKEQLIALYTQMAEHGYNTVDNQQIQVAFSDMEIIKFKDTVKLLFDCFGIKTLLDYGCGGSNYYQPGFSGTRSAVEFFGLEEVFLYEPARNIDARQSADAVICFDVLEHIFITDIPATIRELFKYTKKLLIVNVACYKARALLPNGENAHITVRPAMWWKGMFDAIAIEYPDVIVQLMCSPQYLHAESFDLYRAGDWESSAFFET